MRNKMLINFAVGFIPIFVFIIVDSLYGVKAGLITAIASGLFYFLFNYIRFREVEMMILLDTGLIVVTGGISLLLNNAIFFKIKPAIIELIMTVLVAIHAFSDNPILLNLGKRYMGEVPLAQPQIQMMKSLSRVLFAALLVHTVLIVYSAFFWSEEAWAFVSGGLFYIMMGVILTAQFVYFRFIKKPMVIPSVELSEGEELFDVVDEKGRVVGVATRQQVHGNPQLIHPTVHLHVFNRKGQLFLQKRAATKDLYPGKWDTAVGGHVRHGEPIDAALVRETQEELGFTPKNVQALFRYVMRNPQESELIHVFRIVHDGPFKINRQEIEIGRFWSIFEIKKMLGKGLFTPNFEQEFQILEQNGFL